MFFKASFSRVMEPPLITEFHRPHKTNNRASPDQSAGGLRDMSSSSFSKFPRAFPFA